MIPGPFGRNEGGGQGFDLFSGGGFQRICADAVNPGQYTNHIAVHSRDGYIIGDRSDGAGGIGADSLNLFQLFRIPRQGTVIFVHYLAGALPQITGTGIIPQSFPCFEHILFRRFGQGGKGRKTGKKTIIIGKDRFHTGLLQHGFTDPGTVGVMEAAPGKIPGTAVIPGQQGGRQLFHV